MKKAFTLIELLVAMAVLALMIAFASMVFTVSIDTYRVSMATAEIMQKLRVVTDQLDADFKGLRKDAPLLIWFQQSNTDPNRYDQIMFFADGDFSSIQLYNNGQPDLANGDTVIRGNAARVFYGQATVNSVAPGNEPMERKRILARRQHILTADTTLDDWPLYNTNVLTNFDTGNNEWYEHDRLSLAVWKTIILDEYRDKIIPTCFDFRPRINTNADYHKLFCEGIGSFSIQWAYWDTINGRTAFYWFPSRDPDGNGNPSDSHFPSDGFGAFFNIDGSNFSNWYPSNDPIFTNRIYGGYPAALKFTFTLYDSKSVIRDGMVFSHIVYLEQ